MDSRDIERVEKFRGVNMFVLHKLGVLCASDIAKRLTTNLGGNMYSNQLKKGERYKIPSCDNVFIFDGRYGNNIKCFTREHDKYRFYGREFVEFENGKAYLNLERITTAST